LLKLSLRLLDVVRYDLQCGVISIGAVAVRLPDLQAEGKVVDV
jgi:hypothetical protein